MVKLCHVSRLKTGGSRTTMFSPSSRKDFKREMEQKLAGKASLSRGYFQAMREHVIELSCDIALRHSHTFPTLCSLRLRMVTSRNSRIWKSHSDFLLSPLSFEISL